MITHTLSLVEELQFGNPAICDNLAMVPLFHDSSVDINYLTLDEAMSSSLVQVEELEEEASVSDILFRNLFDKYVLLFEGEELLGAMQNRILNVSVLIPPQTKQELPVSCVEAGRWHHEFRDPSKRNFASAKRMHYARGRALENRSVSTNLDASAVYASDQSGIWSDIEQKSARLRVQSDSSASDAMYRSYQTRIEDHLEKFQHVPGQIGSLFLVNGRVSGIELFSSSSTHEKMLEKLVRSYALDAIDSSAPPSGQQKDRTSKSEPRQCISEAEKFSKMLRSSWTKRFKGVCQGENLRFKDDGITGGALVHEGQVLHLCAFAVSREDEEPIPELVDPPPMQT